MIGILARASFLLGCAVIAPSSTAFTTTLFDSTANIPDAVAYPVAFASSFRVGARVAVINQPRVPSIDVLVGSSVLRLPGGALVRLFYPASSNVTSQEEAPYCTNGRETTNGMSALVGFEQLGLSFLLAHLANAPSGCLKNAPMKADESGSLPLLVYSHGYGGNMDMASFFHRTMASKGMIVASIEHTDGTASSTVIREKDGTERLQRFNRYLMTDRQQLTRRATELLEALDELPGTIRDMFNIETATVMLGGHSYGCPSAIMAANGASSETKCDGLILHDPALGMGYGMLPPNGARIDTPTITYTSDEYNRGRVRYGDTTLHVKGCFHGNFVDAALWAPRVVMRALSLIIPAAGPACPREIHEQLADSAMEFLKCRDASSQHVIGGSLFERVHF
ncbi:hypothetical protein THAOC_33859 [Thalassiosira oceanica]|uniref:1-alkyl-2-acetylglycerophosphocholine esterase n=1 Tax=Thalassiosira oceanica TaxID=159749 RepID=K0R654_THAOC|nr:hypothetical protein THAOC_33859 [Thalassiosira oceanica]|eukprot:EJK47419.1 hypothetical protein THAOC_33859 [Thalassiosira oceanica]